VPDEDAPYDRGTGCVEDISEVHPDMIAEVHLPLQTAHYTDDSRESFRFRLTTTTPDRMPITRPGRVNQKNWPHCRSKLYPGMPAMVIVPTVERTAFDYLMAPLAQSFNTAFRRMKRRPLDCMH